MKRSNLYIICSVFLVISFSVIAVGCGSATPTSSSAGSSAGSSTAVTTLDGQAIMDVQCGRCHSLSRVTSKTKTAAEWKITVDRMITHGANLTPEQEQALIDYLAKNY
jgi:competence protein ComEA